MSLPASSEQWSRGFRPKLVLVQAQPGNRSRRRHREDRRARKAIVWGLLLTAVGQGALAFWLAVQKPLGDMYYTALVERFRRRTAAGPEKPFSVCALGSSRTFDGFRGRRLEEALASGLSRPVVAINFALPGGGPLTSLLTCQRFRRDGVRPDLMLIEVTPVTLQAGVNAAKELNDGSWPLNRLSWSDLAFVERYAGDQRPNLRRDWLWSAAFPTYKYRLDFLGNVTPWLVPYSFAARTRELDGSGQLDIEAAPPTPASRARGTEFARRQFRESQESFAPGGPIWTLREILASCKEQGILAVLILMPEGPTFRSWYPAGTWPPYRDWVAEFSREQGVPLIDTHEWMAEDDFYDSHHLTREGGARFTERLAREHLLPLLRESRVAATR